MVNTLMKRFRFSVIWDIMRQIHHGPTIKRDAQMLSNVR
jgi:hypothetical protein